MSVLRRISRLVVLSQVALTLAACSPDAVTAPRKSGALDPSRTALETDAVQDGLAEVRAATARYHRVEVALAEGYVSTLICAASPAGAMGIHYVNPTLRHDATFDAARPELLLYEPQQNGQLRLVAIEYVVTRTLWDAAHPGTLPTFLGQSFFQSFGPAAHGEPDHYELHVWLWRDNPSGMFAQWNPNVSCL